MSDRSPGPILQAQPALDTVSVKRTVFFSSMLFNPKKNLRFPFLKRLVF